MKEFLYSCSKIVIFTIICYSVLAIPSIPFIFIPNSCYPNVLTLILIKQSAFLISGLIIIFTSRYSSSNVQINFQLSKTIVYYLSTIFFIILFFFVLFLVDIIHVNVNRITSIFSFGKFMIYCAIPTFFIGFGEEFIFRWFLLKRLKSLLKTTTSIIIGSLIFSLGHNWNVPNMLFSFTGGCLFGLIYLRTDSVFNCISIHAAWNFGQRFFFDGMSEFPYNAQRLILLDIKNLDLYNWGEFFFCFLFFSGFIILYFLKDKRIHEINQI